MSDLFCAATLVVARSPEHGTSTGTGRQAESAGESAGEAGRRLAGALWGRKVAAVWTAPAGEELAGSAADALGLPVTVRAELDAAPAVGGSAEVLEELADTFRGETVLVVAGESLFSAVLAAVPRSAELVPLQAGGTAEVEVDADGLVLRRWGSTAAGTP